MVLTMQIAKEDTHKLGSNVQQGRLDKAIEALGEGWWERCSVEREH